jgi:hypothetical protein
MRRWCMNCGSGAIGVPEEARNWSGRTLDLVQRVDLAADEIGVDLDLSSFVRAEAVVRLTVPARIRRRGVERRLVLHGGREGANDNQVDPALVKAIVRARRARVPKPEVRGSRHAELARPLALGEQSSHANPVGGARTNEVVHPDKPVTYGKPVSRGKY